MRYPIALCFFLITCTSNAQYNFVKKWDARFGGLGFDVLLAFQKTPDGGCIAGGSSLSGIGGDKTQTLLGPEDYWVVKIDSLGHKKWDRRLGSSDDDAMFAVNYTRDGGYILGGGSGGAISGDKTQAGRGSSDYWIVKLDVAGNKQWDKRFGGPGDDELYSNIIQTTDGGYFFGGYSESGIGGDKTQENWDTTHWFGDYWVVKTDSMGTKQWDKRFGGVEDEYLQSVQQTDDAGYILGGFSRSYISGDRTQPNWDTVNHTFDYWIVKIDSNGNKQWDRRYGTPGGEGLYSIAKCENKGYLLGGGPATHR